jgi:8-hydroxy-5-deazaflavin:NADPH oxidoreductase
MKLGVIGAGNVGSALVKRLVPHGHQAMLSYSRDPARLEVIARSLGCLAGSPSDAARFGDVIALAVPWAAVPDALHEAGPLDGKILWDCSNPLKPDLSGLLLGPATSGSEEIARMAPGARVVKGIPPFAELLQSGDATVNGRPAGVFVAGDDPAAKETVTSLMSALPAAVTDAGSLEASRLIEPAMLLLVRLAYVQGLGPHIAFSVVR